MDFAVLQTDYVPPYFFPLETADIGAAEPTLTAEESVNHDFSRMGPPQPVLVLGHPGGEPLHTSKGCRTSLLNGAYYEADRWHLIVDCHLAGGFSGSPVVLTATGKVIGIYITNAGWVMKISHIPQLK